MILRGALYIALGRPRSLARDALVALGGMPAPPLVRGGDLVPEGGHVVVVANHYERPGLWMAWPGLYIAHLIRERTGRDTHWIAIQEWESFSLWGIPIPRQVIRAVFERAFGVYGIVAMPPESASASDRAAALRAAATRVRHREILGLMPEGTVGPTPELLRAREGVGAFLLLLAAAGARILPAGVFEEDGRLVVRFGEPFTPAPPRELPREERDAWVRARVMTAIRDLLPEALWGVWRGRPLP
jgi:1-acyl-sn-glycerol-3-phosphate acyltransferase